MTNSRTFIAPGSVKICGNREPESCAVAAAAGADMLGFIFVPGAKRFVDPPRAAECIRSARNAAKGPLLAVGVFVDERPDQIKEIARIAGIDLIQLHGQESPDMLTLIEQPVLKVIKPKSTDSHQELVGQIEACLALANAPVCFLVDGYHPTLHGGAGVKADWNLAAKLAREYPVLLAGGLTPENVGEAIATATPLGVDVSSGVESEGKRDPEKIVQFIASAKDGFSHLQTHQSLMPLARP